MSPSHCPACDLPVPASSSSAGQIYCTAACHLEAGAVQLLRHNVQAAEAAGDNDTARAEREHLVMTVSRIRWQRARDLGRRPKPRLVPGKLR